MSKTILSKMKERLNSSKGTACDAAMKKKFNITTETSYNFIDMRLVTYRIGGLKFTKKQLDFLEGFSEGYCVAMDIVTKKDRKDTAKRLAAKP